MKNLMWVLLLFVASLGCLSGMDGIGGTGGGGGGSVGGTGGTGGTGVGGFAATPEPSTFLLVGIGLVAGGYAVHRGRRGKS